MMRVYIDMDGVLCDFYGAVMKHKNQNPKQPYPQSKWGFFLKLEPIDGAIDAVNKLKENYDVWILTRPSFMNINCYSEKAQWVLDHLGYDMLEKTILCGDKSLVKGHYLIDDQGNAGQENFEGEWIHFGTTKYPNWDEVLKYLL
jgi:5'(3')-deoxyribonucleotidase